MYCVYFIRSGMHIKIGRTKDIQTRLSDISTLTPKGVELLFTIECDGLPHSVYFENVLHDMFKKYRVNGEWFKYSGFLRKFLTVCILGDKSTAIKLMANRMTKSPRDVRRLMDN